MSKDWSNLAKNFDELTRYIVGETTEKMIHEELSTLDKLGSVVELGCGIGSYTKILSPKSKSILATDISKDMLSEARKRLKPFANVEIKKADCYKTGLEDKKYNTVFMANLIHVVEKPDKALEEAHRLLKKGGKLIILSFTADGMSFLNKITMLYRYLRAFGPPPKGGTRFSLKMLTDFVNNHNFKVEEAKLLGDKQMKAIFVVASKV